MSNQPTTPDPDSEEWLRMLKANGDAPHTKEELDQLAIIIEAMRQTGDALTPSEETKRTAWNQIKQAMEKQPQPVQSNWLTSFRHFWSMPAFAPALLASSAALVIGWLVITTQNKDTDITVIAMRGAYSIPVQDFSAQQPKLVQELREIGLEVEVQRETAQILLTIPVSDPPPPALLAWAARWGIAPMPAGKWHIVLIPSPKKIHE